MGCMFCPNECATKFCSPNCKVLYRYHRKRGQLLLDSGGKVLKVNRKIDPYKKETTLHPCIGCGGETRRFKFCSNKCRERQRYKQYRGFIETPSGPMKKCASCDEYIPTKVKYCDLCRAKQKVGTRSRRWELKANQIKKFREMPCSVCGWNEASCDIHHINGINIEDKDGLWNLSVLCPNCHRLVHRGKINKDELSNLL